MDAELWKQKGIAGDLQSQVTALTAELQAAREKVRQRTEEVDELKKKNLQIELDKVHEIEELKKQFEVYKKNSIVYNSI